MAAGVIVVDCARLDRPDLGTVDAFARLALAGRRRRLSLRLERAPLALTGLLDLCGLAELLGLEPGWKAEEGEEAGGVEEEGDLLDPPFS
jgi:hypothetical protein